MTTAELLGKDPGWLIAAKALIVFVICVVSTLMAVWTERRVLAKMQLAHRAKPRRTFWSSAITFRWRQAGT